MAPPFLFPTLFSESAPTCTPTPSTHPSDHLERPQCWEAGQRRQELSSTASNPPALAMATGAAPPARRSLRPRRSQGLTLWSIFCKSMCETPMHPGVSHISAAAIPTQRSQLGGDQDGFVQGESDEVGRSREPPDPRSSGTDGFSSSAFPETSSSSQLPPIWVKPVPVWGRLISPNVPACD